MTVPDRAAFHALAAQGNLVALSRRLMSDQLTPVLAYRRLVAPDERTAPSFLFESVEGGATVGRYSFVGAQPSVEVLACEHDVSVLDHRTGETKTFHDDDPLSVPRNLTARWRLAKPRAGAALPGFTGGWVGYAGYDTVRYLEGEKLPFRAAPRDDRNLPDMHFGLYRQVAVFDHVSKLLHAISHVLIDEYDSIDDAYDAGCAELDEFVRRLETHTVPLPPGAVDLDLSQLPGSEHLRGNFTKQDFESAVGKTKAYIAAGDAFQVVLSQRFERQTSADPFDIYRALRIVNPSPYMIYLQAQGSILVASSPEILCRVHNGIVTNRPLAGTRRRGATPEQDAALEAALRGSEKERAEHIMLVDLGRNDLGRVCETRSITLERIMEVERYSHVMHLSSTITGRLREGLSSWDALRNTLPVGTVSGAPKVRAMQIIDELEPTRRGPYAGGIGAVGFSGDMDIALALRTMVVETSKAEGDRSTDQQVNKSTCGDDAALWTVHLQAGAGIVADSEPSAEYDETVNKAAALGRAIDLAEAAFAPPQ
ncbi:MAG TPA: anthranilate synthase component I [Phycisphaerales bacterium]|nr:anthranilate synthase component I [Phycisphaerales bacterium]